MQWKTILLLPITTATLWVSQIAIVPGAFFPAAAAVVQDNLAPYKLRLAAEEISLATTPLVIATTTEAANTESVEPAGEIQAAAPVAKLYSILVPVCSCESMGTPYEEPRQFNADGTVLQGRIHPPDTGMCQINKAVWLDTALSLGLDINTKEGNARMANYIYDKHGLEPWKASKYCWGPVLLS